MKNNSIYGETKQIALIAEHNCNLSPKNGYGGQLQCCSSSASSSAAAAVEQQLSQKPECGGRVKRVPAGVEQQGRADKGGGWHCQGGREQRS
jgi:hypothetical protein